MIKFIMGVIVGILLFFFFIYFGGSKTMKKVGEELTDTGKKMEVMEQMIKKEKGEMEKGLFLQHFLPFAFPFSLSPDRS